LSRVNRFEFMKRKQVFNSVLFVIIIYNLSLLYSCSGCSNKKSPKSSAEMNVNNPNLWTGTKAEKYSNNQMAQAISADAAIVVDRSTGKVLFEKNADRMEYPASMTKMMTCILAIESGKLDSIVTISANASAASDTYLTRGDRILLSNLLYMLMLSSNNGSAVAIADYLSTPSENFMQMMNQKAKALGMYHTHFITPNGMHHPNHFSTARDMATLASYCMRNPQFKEYVATKQKRITYKYPAGKNIHCYNENKLLDLYDGVNGIKTGFTDIAKGCLTTSYDKNGARLIVVVMHSRKGQLRFYDTMKLLDWTLHKS
jgi:D-alanyl-D-alanine carboxypeptidase (penicillin-binding protein 5/6)